MVEVAKAKRVLEVACGPGRHSLMIAQNFLSPNGSVLVSCDFSNAMVKNLKALYSSPDFDYAQVPGNKYVVDTETDYLQFKNPEKTELQSKCDLDSIIG
mmetsp:Transcript_19374/g.32974  ORF Transcript_19374/g.32974 Transcript_19374/m.32974 type:complete len:99 (-) Transcript_19374:630-926(-)